MRSFNTLYHDAKFSGVSAQTKTDIISTIGVDVEDAKSDIAQSKFTKEQLIDALRYLLATQAADNVNARNLIVRTDDSYISFSNSYYSKPFYYSNNDPLLWYWIGYNAGSNGRGYGGGCFGGSGNSNSRASEGAGNAGAAIVVGLCLIACICLLQKTANGEESNFVKGTKIAVSTLAGIATTILMTMYFIQQEVGHHYFVEDKNWSEGGWGFFMFCVAAVTGCSASVLISLLNNFFICLPSAPTPPAPTPEILEALEDLATIKRLLERGWQRDGDDPEQTNEFVREAILTYIDELSQPQLTIRIDPAARTSANGMFSPSNANNQNNINVVDSTVENDTTNLRIV